MKLDILAVCTGNICRSPAVGRLLAARTGLKVRSAGTHAVVGSAISAPMAELMSDAGIATQGFSATQLTGPPVAAATLVLTATASHSADVLALAPGAADRTFTLRELVRLVGTFTDAQRAAVRDAGGPRARLRALVATAATVRAESAGLPLGGGADDLADPIGRPPNVYAEVYTQINSAVGTLARLLA